MFDDLPAGHVDDLFTDISYVVGDAFKVLNHKQPLHATLDKRRITSHRGDQFRIEKIVNRIDFIVPLDGGAGLSIS